MGCLVVFLIGILAVPIYCSVHSSDQDSEEKCGILDDQLESCIASGYKVKWIKCAARLYAREHFDDADPELTSQNAHQVKQKKGGASSGKSRKPYVQVPVGNGQRRSESRRLRDGPVKKGRTKKRNKRSDTVGNLYVMPDKEKKQCRTFEKRIKNYCEDFTKYSCVALKKTLNGKKRQVLWGELVIHDSGGHHLASVEDELVPQAIKQCLKEFRQRAYSSGNMKRGSTIIIGEVEEVSHMLVAGTNYFITINIGITTDPTCKANEVDGFVTYKKCGDRENLGKANMGVVWQGWMENQWTWHTFEDVEGPPLREKYWDIPYETFF